MTVHLSPPEDNNEYLPEYSNIMLNSINNLAAQSPREILLDEMLNTNTNKHN